MIREGKTHQLYQYIQAGGEYGMQTLDNALLDLLRNKVIDYEHALAKSSNASEFHRRASGAGLIEVGSVT
jgi:twitching motility protein PilT